VAQLAVHAASSASSSKEEKQLAREEAKRQLAAAKAQQAAHEKAGKDLKRAIRQILQDGLQYRGRSSITGSVANVSYDLLVNAFGQEAVEASENKVHDLTFFRC
jgi:FKBP-type peptidyl-prolyl cis-trans isomerase